jgi:hypothetical protein
MGRSAAAEDPAATATCDLHCRRDTDGLDRGEPKTGPDARGSRSRLPTLPLPRLDRAS